MEITLQEARDILVLINRAPIKGSEVEQVAVLKQKLAKIAGLTKIEKLEKKGAE